MKHIAAVVLAAGLSRRMGRSKVLLAWREGETVIEAVVKALLTAEVERIFVIGGHRLSEVSRRVTPLGAQTIMNPDYETGEMLSSFKVGLSALPAEIDAALITLGDQPRIDMDVVSRVVTAYQSGNGHIVAPSYQMRRGHPILIARRYWRELLDLPPEGSPRDVINQHSAAIHYVVVDDDSVLGDIDTPEQYAAERAKAGLPPLMLDEAENQ